jgi:acetyltransferase
MNIQRLTTVEGKREELAALLINCVEDGASIGFLPPLPPEQALQYWDGVGSELRAGSRLLLVALGTGRVVGAVQLALCMKKNGTHRAEVEKLMVHTEHRRAGLGRGLMDELERLASEHQRRLLVLDTRTGDNASILYRRCKYVEAGQIPGYAMSLRGTLDGTTYFYKQL